jgi:hypothetical protein
MQASLGTLAVVPRALAISLVIGALASASCGSPGLRAARQGDLAALRAEIVRERSLCKLDRDTVRSLARETAERELLRSSPAEAMARVEEARACARPLSGPLEELAKSSGDLGAAATLALLESRADGDGERQLRRHGASPNPLWRAVAARAAVGAELGPARRTFYTDGDERVRLSAFRAALDKADRADAHPLLEAARLDPNPLARALASRALGAVANDEIVLALRDVYVRADEGLRQSIVDAWGQKEAAAAGGIRELVRVAEMERGAPSIEAGWVLLRFEVAEARPTGTRALVRAIQGGLARDRVLAITDAPIDDPFVLDQVQKAARTAEPSVKIAALSRLAESRATRDDALRTLALLEKEGSRDARYALARTGDQSALRGVAADLASPNPETRLAAGRLLLGAGASDRAADLLADRDPHVRMTFACAALARPDD